MNFANAVSLVALFVSLGGVGYAAVTITGKNVKNSSLTGTDIKNSSLTGKDVKNSSLTGSDLKNSSVTTSDVKNGSLLSTDFKSGQLPAGPKGDKGDPATADGPAVIGGATRAPGGTPDCYSAPGSGSEVAGPCDVSSIRDRSYVVPAAKVLRNLHASIPSALGNGTRFIVYKQGASGIFECTIAAAQTECSAPGPVSVQAGDLIGVEVDHAGGTALPSSISYGYEMWSPTAGAANVKRAKASARTAADAK
jgi:hypothetical protein